VADLTLDKHILGGGRPTAKHQSALRLRIREIAHTRQRFGYPLHRGPVPQARHTQERWSMDFVHDQIDIDRTARSAT
jgi:hypothetical protein